MGVVSKFCANPTQSHLTAAKRVFTSRGSRELAEQETGHCCAVDSRSKYLFRQLLTNVGESQEGPIVIHEDNQGAIAMVVMPGPSILIHNIALFEKEYRTKPRSFRNSITFPQMRC